MLVFRGVSSNDGGSSWGHDCHLHHLQQKNFATSSLRVPLGSILEMVCFPEKTMILQKRENNCRGRFFFFNGPFDFAGWFFVFPSFEKNISQTKNWVQVQKIKITQLLEPHVLHKDVLTTSLNVAQKNQPLDTTGVQATGARAHVASMSLAFSMKKTPVVAVVIRKFLGGGLKYFLCSSLFWGNDLIWLIFFRWVGSTTN